MKKITLILSIVMLSFCCKSQPDCPDFSNNDLCKIYEILDSIYMTNPTFNCATFTNPDFCKIYWRLSAIADSIGSGGVGLDYFTRSSGLLTPSTATDNLRINGNVGIGTNSDVKLSVYGNVQNPLMKLNNGSNSNYIEFSRNGFTEKGNIGALGNFEMNMSYNMDYKDGIHRYYNSSKSATWLALNERGLFLQYAPPNLPVDIWDNAGNIYPFYVDTLGQSEFVGSAPRIIIKRKFAGTSNIVSDIYGSNSNNPLSLIRTEEDGATNLGKLSFKTSSSLTDRLVIKGDGKVGVNISLPTAQLDVNGNTLFRDNVGIRVLPTSPLTVVATSVGSTGGIRLNGFTTPTDISYWSEAQFAQQFGGVFRNALTANGSSYINGGNLGIGTTSPLSTAKIDVRDATTTVGGQGLFLRKTGVVAGISYGIDIGVSSASTTNIAGVFASVGGSSNYAIIVPANSGNVGIGTSTPNASSILDLTSTTGALIVPRMTTVQRSALTAVNGMIVYDSTLNQFYFYENGAWATK